MNKGANVTTGLVDPHLSGFQVMESAAGYYVGTVWTADDCDACRAERVEPGFTQGGTRETIYFATRGEAEESLEAYQTTGRLPGKRR